MLSVMGALVIAAPVATYAALDQDNQGPPVIGRERLRRRCRPRRSRRPALRRRRRRRLLRRSRRRISPRAADGQPVKIYSYGADKQLKLLATIGPDDYGHVKASITVSPDGTRLAWVNNNKELYVANINGSNKRKLVTGMDSDGKYAPSWTPDGQRLVTNKGDVEVSSGA